ncbi:hypothetical protein NSB25_26725 [Acetatifactor muris]|uniref:Uncharacterized protein n=1 Tax=Acetatifactor muris TaxID=879566 RepID=A0A2K4ZPC5_9FIRM|nr:hypothetical protein [Acetatifactor muris]MCR2050829.1 hypothetical protein [Acetatifactor muris]SOY32343.1 hypothetical protein AMURIS_05101 [Acetatifactor muris]
MERKLFEAFVKECEAFNMHHANNSLLDEMISMQRISAIKMACEEAGIILYFEMKNNYGTIIHVSLSKDGELLEVTESLWDGR